MEARRWDENRGKTRSYKGDQTGRSVKWVEKKCKMVWELTGVDQ